MKENDTVEIFLTIEQCDMLISAIESIIDRYEGIDGNISSKTLLLRNLIKEIKVQLPDTYNEGYL